jgi:hypothetical protein
MSYLKITALLNVGVPQRDYTTACHLHARRSENLSFGCGGLAFLSTAVQCSAAETTWCRELRQNLAFRAAEESIDLLSLNIINYICTGDNMKGYITVPKTELRYRNKNAYFCSLSRVVAGIKD